MFISVVLPDPDAPMIAPYSPGGNCQIHVAQHRQLPLALGVAAPDVGKLDDRLDHGSVSHPAHLGQRVAGGGTTDCDAAAGHDPFAFGQAIGDLGHDLVFQADADQSIRQRAVAALDLQAITTVLAGHSQRPGRDRQHVFRGPHDDMHLGRHAGAQGAVEGSAS